MEKLSKAKLETPGHKNEKVGEVVSTKMSEDHRGGSQPPRAAPEIQADHRQAQEILCAR